jgi:hypothetical protein
MIIKDCDIHRQNRFEVVWRSSAGGVAERCCTIYVIESMKKGRAQHHYQRAGETRDYCVRGPPDDDANNTNQHQTSRDSCSLCIIMATVGSNPLSFLTKSLAVPPSDHHAVGTSKSTLSFYANPRKENKQI